MSQGLYNYILLFIGQHILVLCTENNSHYTFHFHNILGHQPIKLRERLQPIFAGSFIFPSDIENLRIQNNCNTIFLNCET
jgi:hypothetical protein